MAGEEALVEPWNHSSDVLLIGILSLPSNVLLKMS
jgi:hypothetical protein